MCSSCVEIWNKQQDKQQNKQQDKKQNENSIKLMLDFIRKYIKNKEKGFYGIILGCYQHRDKLIDKYSLNNAFTHFKDRLNQSNQSRKSGLTSYEMDQVVSDKKLSQDVLEFLTDFEKMYKLFQKKGINTDYREILSLFKTVIDEEINLEYDRIINPSYKKIKKVLGDDISVPRVVQEFMRLPWDIEHYYEIVARLLDKFELKYDKDEVQKIINEVKEELELEEFEENLGSSKTIEIGDFEHLSGYEFEGYLKKLFELLGYIVVETILSGDQGGDLVISKDNKKTVVQAKKYDGKVSNKAIQEVVAARNHYHADYAMVVTNSNFTKSAIELALSNKVELWDGSKLRDTINKLKSGKRRKDFSSKQSLKLEKGKDIQNFKITCPVCEEEFNIDVDIRDGIDIEVKCPHCGSPGNLKAETNIWKCEFCSAKFKTKSEAVTHENTCKGNHN